MIYPGEHESNIQSALEIYERICPITKQNRRINIHSEIDKAYLRVQYKHYLFKTDKEDYYKYRYLGRK